MKSNSTQTEYAQSCIHQLVEAVVKLLPDTLAVVFEQFRKSSLLGVQAERSVLISQQVRVEAS
jgi:hypothetical protein